MPCRMGRAEFAELVELALAELPEEFARFIEEVPVEIVDRPTPQQRKRLNLRDDQLLLGLYHGRPLTQRSVEDSGAMPDLIYIFQDSIQAVSFDRDGLIAQVRKTVLHEIGHHFGMSEADLEELGYG
jgi:predicted Zn-dependent protease with MMP-like domain